MIDRRRAEYTSPQDAATMMSVSASTILRLIKSGKLPATRIGMQWRIRVIDLRKGSQDVATGVNGTNASHSGSNGPTLFDMCSK